MKYYILYNALHNNDLESLLNYSMIRVKDGDYDFIELFTNLLNEKLTRNEIM